MESFSRSLKFRVPQFLALIAAVQILGGYGYQPLLASMEACVDAAQSGRLA